jgi:hypothetical protein
MEDSNGRRIPWALFVSELMGTALLVLVGRSPVNHENHTHTRLR